MPPLTCPQPPRQPDKDDCPLYAARLDEIGQDAALRRLIFMERGRVPDLAALIRAEAKSSTPAPRHIAALPPASEPFPLPILDHLKESHEL